MEAQALNDLKLSELNCVVSVTAQKIAVNLQVLKIDNVGLLLGPFQRKIEQ